MKQNNKQEAIAIFHNGGYKIFTFNNHNEFLELKNKYGSGKNINGQTVKQFIVYEDKEKQQYPKNEMLWREYDKKKFMFKMTDGADDVIKVYQRQSDKLFLFAIRLPFTTNKNNNFKNNNNPSWLIGLIYPSQLSTPTLLGEYSTRKEAYDKMDKYMKQHN